MVTDEFLVDLAELARAPRSPALVGGKARNLARLMSAGIAIPPGFVVTAPAVAMATRGDEEWAPIVDAIANRARRLRAPLIVRSSAAIEDGSGTVAPGLFATRRDVAHEELELAMATVWRSAQSATVAAYLDALGMAAPAQMAIILQEQLEAPFAGVIYTRAVEAWAVDHAIIELRFAGAHYSAEVTRCGAAIDVAADFPLDQTATSALLEAALAAEQAIAADAADVEWVGSSTHIHIVQARPIPAPVRARQGTAPAPELFAFSRAQPQTTWHWDANHNPEPLSPAHAGLVERVDQRGLAAYEQRLVGGYLYYTQPDQQQQGDADALLDADALRAYFAAEFTQAVERLLAPIEYHAAPDLTAALQTFDEVYRLYSHALAPLLRAARARLTDALSELVGADEIETVTSSLIGRPGAHLDHLLAAVVAGDLTRAELIDRVGALAPRWDVAVPTYAERPELLDQAICRHRATPGREASGASIPPQLDLAALTPMIDLARAAHDIGEIDDLIYGRAQALIRRALLAIAARWQLSDPEDIFYLPLELTRASTHAPENLADLVASNRQARELQLRQPMPMAFRNGRPLSDRSRGMLRGRGSGGRVVGVVIHHADLGANRLPANPILVTDTLTPAMTFMIQGICALVCEHGGLLGHGAAMARELGIPCVVGCRGATTNLCTNDRVWVDGQAGVVVRIQG